MNSLQKNEMYQLVELPKGLNDLKYKWVFKIKEMMVKFKARLVVKTLGRKEGLTWMRCFPLLCSELHPSYLGLEASMDLELKQLHMKTDFFHGYLKRYLYSTTNRI